jgi:hypothetical protein
MAGSLACEVAEAISSGGKRLDMSMKWRFALVPEPRCIPEIRTCGRREAAAIDHLKTVFSELKQRTSTPAESRELTLKQACDYVRCLYRKI